MEKEQKLYVDIIQGFFGGGGAKWALRGEKEWGMLELAF